MSASQQSTRAATPTDVKQPSPPLSSHEKTTANVAEKGAPAPANEADIVDTKDAITGFRFAIIFAGLTLYVFLASLDQTIVAPAIPVISNDFKSTSDVAWYSSAYLMTSTALLPFYSRLYRHNLKWPYISSLVIFEIGSLICALAHNSSTFIVGRALAGTGLAGGYVGTMTIIAVICNIEDIAKYTGMVGATYGIGAILGPIIGGVFTTEVTWRWCFWINLPIGGLTFAIILFFFQAPKMAPWPTENGYLRMIYDFDIIGTAFLLCSLICLILVTQWGGIKYTWSSSEIIGLIVGFVVIMLAFIAIEIYMGERALVPPRIFKQRTVFFAFWTNAAVGAAYFTTAFFLPLYYQIRGSSSIRSGVQLLPMVCAVIVAVTLAGGLTPVLGYGNPIVILGFVLLAVGCGLLQIFNETTPQATWAGVTFLLGFGAGLAWQIPFVITQAALTGMDAALAGAIVLFAQTLGGTLFASSAQSIFQNVYAKGVFAIPGITNPLAVVTSGETGFRSLVTPELIPAVEHAAIKAVKDSFAIPVAVACFGAVTSLGIGWHSTKNQGPVVAA